MGGEGHAGLFHARHRQGRAFGGGAQRFHFLGHVGRGGFDHESGGATLDRQGAHNVALDQITAVGNPQFLQFVQNCVACRCHECRHRHPFAATGGSFDTEGKR